MTREQIAEQVAVVMHGAITVDLGNLSWLEVGRRVADVLRAADVLIVTTDEDPDPMDQSLNERLRTQLQTQVLILDEYQPDPAISGLVVPATSPDPAPRNHFPLRGAVLSLVEQICPLFRETGVLSGTLSASGSGDEGQIDNIEFFSQEELSDAQEGRLRGLMERLWEALLSLTGHDGYWNNEGGGDTFTIYEDGRIDYDTYINQQSEDYNYYQFSRMGGDGG